MSIELKAGDYFRRDMGEAQYRAVVEKLIEAGMDRYGGEPVGAYLPCEYFGWSVLLGGLYHGGRAGESEDLTGRLLSFEDVFPQTPPVDPNPQHWDGAGEPQVGQMVSVSAEAGVFELMLGPDIGGYVVIRGVSDRWMVVGASMLYESPESERMAGIAAVRAELGRAQPADADLAERLYTNGVRVVKV